jgi:hypothetical protein
MTTTTVGGPHQSSLLDADDKQPDAVAATKVSTLLKQVVTGKQTLPRRVLIYGIHGVGKSTFAAASDAPIVIQTEDGLADIDVPRFPLATDLGQGMAAIKELYTTEHDFRTVVIDSLDWLELLIWSDVCRAENVPSIEKIGYAKGYIFALDRWRKLLDGMSALRNKRGMGIVLIAHSRIERFEDPTTDTYDRYVPRLHKHASAIVQEYCDEVFFATYKIHTRQTDAGFNRTRTQAIGTGQRVLRTSERPPHLAKNRLNMPDEIELSWPAYASFFESRGDS